MSHQPQGCPEVRSQELGDRRRGGYSTARAGGGHVARTLLHVDSGLHPGSRRARHRSVSATGRAGRASVMRRIHSGLQSPRHLHGTRRRGWRAPPTDERGVGGNATVPPLGAQRAAPGEPRTDQEVARGCSMRGIAGMMPVLVPDPPFMNSDPLGSTCNVSPQRFAAALKRDSAYEFFRRLIKGSSTLVRTPPRSPHHGRHSGDVDACARWRHT